MKACGSSSVGTKLKKAVPNTPTQKGAWTKWGFNFNMGMCGATDFVISCHIKKQS